MNLPAKPEWLTRKEASAFLSDLGCGVSLQTLARYAVRKNERDGPPFYRFQNRVRYRADELRLWAENKTERVL